MHASQTELAKKVKTACINHAGILSSYLTIPSAHIIHVLHYLWHRLQSYNIKSNYIYAACSCKTLIDANYLNCTDKERRGIAIIIK